MNTLCDKAYWKSRHGKNVDINEVAKLNAYVNNEAIKGKPEDMVV